MSYLVQMLGLDARRTSVGRDRHRARDRADPRLRAAFGAHRRQFLGRRDPLHALHAAADLRALTRCFWSGRACRRRSAPTSTPTTLEGAKQMIALGPVASQIAIKMLGTNGGGFFNANAAHPFENPTRADELRRRSSRSLRSAPRSPCVRPHGRQSDAGLGDARPRWAFCLWLGVDLPAIAAEAHGNDRAQRAAGSPAATWRARRCASASSPRRCSRSITTATSSGAVNAMHDSFTAAGRHDAADQHPARRDHRRRRRLRLYGMLMFVIMAVFVAGLMVGRTPEYLGKKIEAKEVKMAMLAILILPLLYLGWTAVGDAGAVAPSQR